MSKRQSLLVKSVIFEEVCKVSINVKKFLEIMYDLVSFGLVC